MCTPPWFSRFRVSWSSDEIGNGGARKGTGANSRVPPCRLQIVCRVRKDSFPGDHSVTLATTRFIIHPDPFVFLHFLLPFRTQTLTSDVLHDSSLLFISAPSFMMSRRLEQGQPNLLPEQALVLLSFAPSLRTFPFWNIRDDVQIGRVKNIRNSV